jgi:hypothetical protein
MPEDALKTLRPLTGILFVIILICGYIAAFMPQPVQANNVIAEYTTGDNTASTFIWGANYRAQTFTALQTAAVQEVWLKLAPSGSPTASYCCAIRNTAAGAPTGANIVSANITATIVTTTDWYVFTMPSGTILTSGTKYAIVLYSDNATTTDKVTWRYNSTGAYTGGQIAASADSGATWSLAAPIDAYDFMFQVLSTKSMEIQDVKVFTGYKEVGDWLITVRYIDTYPSYYSTYDIRRYFVLQLIDIGTSTVKATNSLTRWGNRVGNIYLNAATVSPLTYGGAYKVRLYGTFTGNPYTDYTLLATDWLGSDLANLDSWTITSASVMYTYDYGSNISTNAYTTDIATRGTVLTATGGTILSDGINGLQTVRPALFQIYTATTPYTPATGTATLANAARTGTAAAIGPDAVTAFQRLGQDSLGGLPYNYVIAIVAMVLCFGLAAGTFPYGHTTAANVICIGVLFAFAYFGFDWIWIVMIYAVSAFLLAKKLWIDTGM